MTYQEVVGMMRGISSSSLMSKKIPMKIKLPVLYNIGKLSEALNRWDVSYGELLRRYANKDADGNPVIIGDHYDIPAEFMDDYNKEFKDIMSCDSGLSGNELQKVPVGYFDSYDEEKFDILTLQEIQSLQSMIDYC